MIKIVECPRDAMQGIHEFIPTQKKVDYINSLLKVGFDTIDFGSFVSPKTIPQMKDTAEVLAGLDLKSTKSKLLAIIANVRGAEDAVAFNEIAYLGFPFSISETFQVRNTNSTIVQSLSAVENIQGLCKKNNKELVVYISMGFGNPYGDPWNPDIVNYWVNKLVQLDIKIIALADTVGVSNTENIAALFSSLLPAFPQIEFGAHLHSRPEQVEEKIHAAFTNGCMRFDAAMMGLGGCPMANDDLVGNVPTEKLMAYFQKQNKKLEIDLEAFNNAKIKAFATFP